MFTGPISALGTPTRKHIQRKPMVKMPSKDSGTGNSVESSRSNGSKDEDFLIHGDEASFGSSVLDKGFKKDVNKPMPFRKPFVKQESTGIASMVSPLFQLKIHVSERALPALNWDFVYRVDVDPYSKGGKNKCPLLH